MKKIKSKFNTSYFKGGFKKLFTLHFSLLTFSANRQKGFSLVELIIYIAIFTVAMAVGAQLLTVTSRIRSQTEARYEVQQNIRFAVEKISEQIKKASAISGVYPSNTLTLTVSGQSVVFNLSNGILTMQEGAGPVQNLTTDSVVASAPDSGYLFTKIDNPAPSKSSVQIKLKMDYNSLDRPDWIYGTEMRTTVSLR